jgi:hypothetical protein
MYIACSVQSQSHGVSIIFTTACWANEGEGGTGDTQIYNQELEKSGRSNARASTTIL